MTEQLTMIQELQQRKGRNWVVAKATEARGVPAYEKLTWLLMQAATNPKAVHISKCRNELQITMNCLQISCFPTTKYLFKFRGGNVEALIN